MTEPKGEKPTFVHKDFLFLIVGKHPHAGEKAHPIGESPDTMTLKDVFGVKMYLLELIDCPHGTDRCYAEKKNMKMLKSPPKG